MYIIKMIETETEKTIHPILGLYLDYVNNFISVQSFADHYFISIETANGIIESGKEYHYLTIT